MSNILIIKHGSLGDLIQANGAIKDIKNANKDSKVYLLTSRHYVNLMSQCPYIDGILIDKRLPRWNLVYLYNLKRILTKYNFSIIFDLQNSSRTRFYRKFLFRNIKWSSSETILEPGQKKKNFDKEPVLERFKVQLEKSNIATQYVKQIDLSWALEDISKLIRQYGNEGYFLIFPFCSKKNSVKKWPYFKKLIAEIKFKYKNKYPILIAPGFGEIEEAKTLNAKIMLDDEGNPISLNKLISLINNAKFIITNDTGPAHICSHLNKNGIALFGSHTSAKKVSVGSSKFKTISVENLSDLEVKQVIYEIQSNLN